MSNTSIVTIPARGGSIRVELADTVAPLGAFRTHAAAERNLSSYDDVRSGDEDIVDASVDFLVDLDGKGAYFVSLFEYNRPVLR